MNQTRARRLTLLDLLSESWLPVQARWPELQAMGFVCGPVVDEDPLFLHAELPPRWRKKAPSNDEVFWIVDERGIERVYVSYWTMQGQRRATAMIVDVGREAADDVVYGEDKPTLPTFWEAMTSTERAAFVEVLDEAIARENEGVCAAEEAERARTVLENARLTEEVARCRLKGTFRMT